VLTTAAINGPRFNHVYNGSSWVSKGLLIEEQRTNIATYSEDFSNAAYGISGVTVLANQVAAPDGNATADKLTMTSSGTFYQSPLYGSAGTQTGSVWLRADSTQTVMLRIANDSGGESTTSTITVTTSWQRFSVARTFAANPTKIWFGIDQRSFLGGPNAAATIYGWGYQIELGAFPTSYIPTTTAAVTRSADVCSFTGTNFSQWFNQPEGTFSIDFDLGIPSSANYGFPIFAISDVSTNLHRMYFDCTPTDNAFRWYIRHDPSGQSTQLKPGPYAGNYTTQKAAMVYKLDDIAISLNGSSPLTSTTQTVPTGLNQLEFVSNDAFGSGRFNGHISRLRYYNTRLANSKLQELST
jgi:hypothetical protein